MPDFSYLDRRYFLTGDTYNCPFCNRRSVTYKVSSYSSFYWSADKAAMTVFTTCGGCGGVAMHLTYVMDLMGKNNYGLPMFAKKYHDDLDAQFFFHQPTSFFTLDERIPRVIRELASEAENCRRSGFLVGASACLRKAIYELLGYENVAKTESDGRGGERERHYQDRVKELKGKRPNMDEGSIDVLAHALTATSDQLHEDSWSGWTGREFDVVHSAVMAVLDEMYVLPDERKQRADKSVDMLSRLREGKAAKAAPKAAETPRTS